MQVKQSAPTLNLLNASPTEVPLLPIVLQNKSFTVSPCIDCDVPGYLVLVARDEQAALSRLSDETLAQLGPTLGRLEAAVQKVADAEHVYILRFSEGLSSVHFHIFPRTRKLAEQWLASAKPPDKNLNGPHIFAWARIRYHVDKPEQLSARTLEVATLIRDALSAG
jgi:diadenosine tetraphosphate (Ap4A) HIT family hydrolase